MERGWQFPAVNTHVTIDKAKRVPLSKAVREAAGIKPGQTLQVQASPGMVILSTPTIPARLIKRGKLKIIDGRKQELSAAEAVARSRETSR